VRPVRLLTPALLLAVLAAGCGGSSGDEKTAAEATTPPAAKAAEPVADFPQAKGKRLSELRAGLQEGLVLAPSVSVLEEGRNRYGFALFDAARKQVAGAPVALYISRKDGSGVRGPFVARSESLEVKPQYRSSTTTDDPDAANSVYVADVDFPKAGSYRVTALAELDGRKVSTTSFGAKVEKPGAEGLPPAVGEAAPNVATPTLSDVAGDAARISTRQPAAEDLLQTNLKDVYGKKPVALLFATPALCQSRVCGPVVDVMEQVRAETKGDDVAFIANEIYNENRVDRGLRPEPAAYRIPTEPWLFVLDGQGRVADRIEGAFSAEELKAAIRKAKAGAST
jgi:hypothetical protein